MIACHLLKFCDFLTDTDGYKMKLYYLRDIERREVDFLITVSEKPWFAVEVKRSSKSISSHLKYFMNFQFLPREARVFRVWRTILNLSSRSS
jgi:hypothetical protein